MLVPAVLFPLGLWMLRNHPRFQWLSDPARYPWELWTVAVCGTLATIGGTLDWVFHRSGLTAVGRHEHRCHMAALVGGGIPLFLVMAFASLSHRPLSMLLPAIVIVIGTVVLICYDEFAFHTKRCDWFETLTHRALVFGNGLAWLAWSHWCFVRGGAYAWPA